MVFWTLSPEESFNVSNALTLYSPQNDMNIYKLLPQLMFFNHDNLTSLEEIKNIFWLLLTFPLRYDIIKISQKESRDNYDP